MSLYLPAGIHPADWFQRLRSALAGLYQLTVDDMIVLMGGDDTLAGPEDRAMAELDLRTMGYVKARVSMNGTRSIFLRYVRFEHWPEDEVHDQCARERRP